MEKKKYQNPTMEEIEVKEQLLAGSPGEGGSDNSRSTSSSSFDDED